MAYKPHWSHASYAMDAYTLGSDYRNTRKNHYGRGTSFASAVGYSAPGLAMTYATRNSKLKYAIPATIATDAAARYAVNKTRKRYAKRRPRRKK